MSRIAIIPARSGSKGLKDKNILPLNGKPLMAYSIECAVNSNVFDKIFVSTDSMKYAAIASKYGAEAIPLRSLKNSTDSATSWDVVREVIGYFESNSEFYEEIMLLQVTSPLRIPEDIINCIELLHNKKANAVQSVTEMEHSPLCANVLPANGCMDNFINEKYDNVPRQMLPKYYRQNGAIYLLNRTELNKAVLFQNNCFAYIMPQERSIDIDTEFDFKMAQVYLN